MRFVLSAVLLVMLCALALAEPRLQPEARSAVAATLGRRTMGISGKHPYLFLSVPRGRSGDSYVQGYKLADENDANNAAQAGFAADDGDDDDDDDDFADNERFILGRRNAVNDDDDDDDQADDYDDDDNDEPIDDDAEADEEEHAEAILPVRAVPKQQTQKIIKQAKPTHMMVAREHAGAIMVPDGIIELEGQSVIDEHTGKAALIVPRAALDAIPDGSVVALMERSSNGASIADVAAEDENEEEEARANRVIVRRRRKGGRRSVRRRRGGNKGGSRRRRRRRGGNRRRNNVRIVRLGNGNRRRVVRRGSNAVVRPVLLQG